MEPGLSVQMIWPLAAQEAIAADFECIEPPHLFSATLKFVELEEQQIDMAVQDAKTVTLLLKERDELRKKLHEHSINVPERSSTIRRKLRQRMGKGGRPYDGQRVIHRSDASRELCQRAEQVAHAAKEEHWRALHLLEAILESPPAEIGDVLTDVGLPGGKPMVDTPLLNEFGRDLSALGVGGKIGGRPIDLPAIPKDPVCKVVIAEIMGKEKTNLLLVQKGKRAPKEVIGSIAAFFKSDKAPVGMKGRRIIEIDAARIIKETPAKELEERMDALFREASQATHIMLFLNGLHLFFDPKIGGGIPDMLRRRITKDRMSCVAAVDEAGYLKHIKKDPGWKKVLRPIWIHDLESPTQL